MQDTILEMNGIDKRFSGVHALKSVHFDLKADGRKRGGKIYIDEGPHRDSYHGRRRN